MNKVIRLFRNEEGATMVEYALMITFVALACIAAVILLGASITNIFGDAQLTGAL